jgi:hypothetical protein
LNNCTTVREFTIDHSAEAISVKRAGTRTADTKIKVRAKKPNFLPGMEITP